MVLVLIWSVWSAWTAPEQAPCPLPLDDPWFVLGESVDEWLRFEFGHTLD